MLDLPLGQQFAGPLGEPDTGPIGGTAYYQLPMTGSLATTFYDYSAVIETSSRKLIAVSARRIFPSFADCRVHLGKVTQELKAKYVFKIARDDPFQFDGTSGAIRAVGLCSTTREFVNTSLRVRVSDEALSQASEKRINEHFDTGAP
jgi:hypothetical protein